MESTPGLYEVFEKLFRDNYNELANYAFSIIKSRDDAEDLVQDVFVRIWQKDPTIIQKDGIKFYLFTAIKNNCISWLRKQSGKTFVEPDKVHLSAAMPEDRAPSPEPDYTALVNEALSRLPPQCLAIFKLSRFANLTYRQIADELNLSVKTVENQMGKALKLMREFARDHNIPLTVLLFVISQQLYACTFFA
jgi:RNA polymerase sigma-70 factor (family 1)